MSQSYRVGIIGFAHMHINSLVAQFSQDPQAELVASADTIPAIPELREGLYTRGWNLKRTRDTYKVSKIYEDYGDLLKQEQPFIVLCCAENA